MSDSEIRELGRLFKKSRTLFTWRDIQHAEGLLSHLPEGPIKATLQRELTEKIQQIAGEYLSKPTVTQEHHMTQRKPQTANEALQAIEEIETKLKKISARIDEIAGGELFTKSVWDNSPRVSEIDWSSIQFPTDWGASESPGARKRREARFKEQYGAPLPEPGTVPDGGEEVEIVNERDTSFAARMRKLRKEYGETK